MVKLTIEWTGKDTNESKIPSSNQTSKSVSCRRIQISSQEIQIQLLFHKKEADGPVGLDDIMVASTILHDTLDELTSSNKHKNNRTY